jgi:hypothetical protein
MACGAEQTAAGTPDGGEFTLVQAADSVPLPFNKIVRVGSVLLQLTEVSDSRCPEGVQCVWEGDGVASIAVHPPCYLEGCKAASIALRLHTRLEPRSGTGWNHRVVLVGLQPAPVANQTVEPRRYVAWVKVTPA